MTKTTISILYWASNHLPKRLKNYNYKTALLYNPSQIKTIILKKNKKYSFFISIAANIDIDFFTAIVIYINTIL